MRRLAEIEKKIANLTRALETGLDSDVVRQRLAKPEIDRKALAPKAAPTKQKAVIGSTLIPAR